MDKEKQVGLARFVIPNEMKKRFKDTYFI